MKLAEVLNRRMGNVVSEKIAAQKAWRTQTGQMLPTLRAHLSVVDSMGKSVRSEKARAGDCRTATVVDTMALCRTVFGKSSTMPVKTTAVLGAFKGTPTVNLSEEIQLAYQLQRFYDLQK